MKSGETEARRSAALPGPGVGTGGGPASLFPYSQCLHHSLVLLYYPGTDPRSKSWFITQKMKGFAHCIQGLLFPRVPDSFPGFPVGFPFSCLPFYNDWDKGEEGSILLSVLTSLLGMIFPLSLLFWNVGVALGLGMFGWSWLSSDFQHHKATEMSKSMPAAQSGTRTPHFTGLWHRLRPEPLALAPSRKPKKKFQALSEEPGTAPDGPGSCQGGVSAPEMLSMKMKSARGPGAALAALTLPSGRC